MRFYILFEFLGQFDSNNVSKEKKEEKIRNTRGKGYTRSKQ